jgi:hypothetical protein
VLPTDLSSCVHAVCSSPLERGGLGGGPFVGFPCLLGSYQNQQIRIRIPRRRGISSLAKVVLLVLTWLRLVICSAVFGSYFTHLGGRRRGLLLYHSIQSTSGLVVGSHRRLKTKERTASPSTPSRSKQQVVIACPAPRLILSGGWLALAMHK